MIFRKYLLTFFAIIFIYCPSYCASNGNEIYENNVLVNSLLDMENVFLKHDEDSTLNLHNGNNWSANTNKCKCINGRCETACAEWKNGACLKTKQVCVCHPEFGKYEGKYEEKMHEYHCIYCNCGKGFNCTFDFKRTPGDEKACICPEGYYDHNGECAKNCSESRPCQHGGKCQNGMCKCQSEETYGPFCERVYHCSYMCTPRNTADCVYNQVKKTYDCLCKNRSLVYDYQEELCKPCPCGEGTCVDGVHDFKCNCKAGYQEFKKQCIKCDCGPDQHCELHWKTGEKICECKQGYFEREGICLACDCGHKEATCKLDNVGRKSCICPKGYEDNFGLCEKIVKRENCTCHPTAKCNETDDGFICACEDGYTGQINEHPEPGEPCIDYDECVMMAKCKGENQKCVNFEGSFMCQCRTGYQPVGGIDEFGEIKCEKYKVSWAPAGITIGVILAFLVASAGFIIFLKKRESSSIGSSGFELRFSRR